MKVLQQSLGETHSKEVKTLPSHLMNFQWSCGQKWNPVRDNSEIPEWLQEFRENLVDDEVPLQ